MAVALVPENLGPMLGAALAAVLRLHRRRRTKQRPKRQHANMRASSVVLDTADREVADQHRCVGDGGKSASIAPVPVTSRGGLMSRRDAFEPCRQRSLENARRLGGSARLSASSQSERFWRDPSGQRSWTAVRAFSGVASAARRDLMPVPTPNFRYVVVSIRRAIDSL